MDLEDSSRPYIAEGTATWHRLGRVGGFSMATNCPINLAWRGVFTGIMLAIAPKRVESVHATPLGISWVYPDNMTAVELTAADSVTRNNVEAILARMGVGASGIDFHADTLPVPVKLSEIDDGWNFSFSGGRATEPVLIARVVLDAAAKKLTREVGCTEARRIKQQLIVRHPSLGPEVLLVATAIALNEMLGVMNSGERLSVIWPVPNLAATLWTPPGQAD